MCIHPLWISIGIVGATCFLGLVIAKMGILIALAMIGLPLVFGYLAWQFADPSFGLWTAFISSFFATGLTRYVPAPLGLTLDIFLALAWIGTLFKRFNHTDWSPLHNGMMALVVAWFGLIFIEIGNPEARSFVAWFFAMRGVGLYMLMTFGLVFMYCRHYSHLERFLRTICWISIMAAIWGIRQKFIGTDAAEDKWLAVEGNRTTHILFGSLRTFSFYSDAGQFGASMAHVTLMAGILGLGSNNMKDRIFYFVTAGLCLVGFGISGTRGALIVPAFGGITYLLMKKNFKILIIGVTMGLGCFVFLKYTTALQNVEAIRRIRTGLDPDNPSLQTRFRNQKTYRKYLATRPIGAGVGSAGYWGKRFSPGTVPAETATDSYFVRIWAELGIVGLLLNMTWLGYWIGRAGNNIWNLRDPKLTSLATAYFCGVVGIMASSYGNQVWSSLPTGMIMNFGMPMLILLPLYEKQIEEEQKALSESTRVKNKL